MAYESQETLRVGDKSPVYGTFTFPTGTGTFGGSSTFTLYNYLGNVVSGFNGVSVTGVTPGAISEGDCWYNLDTSTLTPGIYYGVFHFSVTGSDSLVRNKVPDVQVIVLPLVEVVASYDPLTVRGQTRMWLRDIDTGGVPTTPGTAIGISTAIWSDGEVDNLLLSAGYPGSGTDIAQTTDGTTVTDNTVKYVIGASIIGWYQVLADSAKLSVAEKIAIFSNDTSVTYDSIKDYINILKSNLQQESAGIATTPDTFYGLTVSTSNPDTTFVTGSSELQAW